MTVGSLVDPLNRRAWDPQEVRRQIARRLDCYSALGVRPSDRLFLHDGNSIEFFVDLLALWQLGACIIPIDGRLSPFEIATLARTARPRFSLWRGDPDEHVTRPLADLGITSVESPSTDDGRQTATQLFSLDEFPREQDALILFTSGTTGEPKGVVHSHSSLQARWAALHANLGVHAFRRTLCLLPTHFGHGLICNCLFPWLAGQDLFILPAFRADVLTRLGPLIDEHAITFMSSVPAMWRLALKTSRPPQSRCLERVFCGSAPLSASLWKSIQEWSGTNDVFNVYGITETASWLAGMTGGDQGASDGLVGAAWGGTIKILSSSDVGQHPATAAECAPGEAGYIWVHTPALMKGYLDNDDLTRQVVADGWFLTRDIGFLDRERRLHLVGREREEINKAGMKIYPTDVDRVIEGFEQTVDVCTFAYDEPLQGEDVGVAVVLDPDDAGVRHALYVWAKQHLGPHQVPRRWYVVGEIFRTSRGKLNRTEMARYCAALPIAEMRHVSRRGIND